MTIRFRVAYIAVAFSVVALLIRLVRAHKTDDLDATVTRAIQRRTNPWFARVMYLVSWAGFPPQSRTLPLVFPALLLLAGRRIDALFQLMGWGTSAISGTLKQIMRRPRPHKDHFRVLPARIGGTSFPSGHVINYTGVYGFLAFLAYRHVRPAALRRAVVGSLASLIALVGPSRIYLGHHWFTDVVTSYLLGSSYLLTLTALYDWVRARRRV